MRFHHQETSNWHTKRRWSLCYISFTRMVNFWIKKCSEWFPELVEKWRYNYWRFPRRIFLSKVSVKHRTCVTNTTNVLTWTRPRETPYDLNWPTCDLLWKSLQINTIARFAFVSTSCFFWKWITFILQMHFISFWFVLTRGRVDISLAAQKLFSNQNNIFWQGKNHR